MIRTIGAVDLAALRRETAAIAGLISEATAMRITSAEGTDLTIDLEGLSGDADDGYLWDPDRGAWKSRWQTLPPAVPGVALPTGRANGVVAVDGFILYEPSYDHETPKTPLILTIEDSWIIGISGDPLTGDRLRHWLAGWDPDRSVYHGPVHANIGLNPRAMMTQHQEFEAVRGTIVFGWGDSATLARLFDAGWEGVASPVHWDCSAQRPTIDIGDRRVVEDGWVQDLL